MSALRSWDTETAAGFSRLLGGTVPGGIMHERIYRVERALTLTLSPSGSEGIEVTPSRSGGEGIEVTRSPSERQRLGVRVAASA